jgi:hypothetical protein
VVGGGGRKLRAGTVQLGRAERNGRRKERTRLASKNSSDFQENREGRVTESQTTGLILRRAPPQPCRSFHPLSPHWAPEAPALAPRWPSGSSLRSRRIHLGRQKSIRTDDPAVHTHPVPRSSPTRQQRPAPRSVWQLRNRGSLPTSPQRPNWLSAALSFLSHVHQGLFASG